MADEEGPQAPAPQGAHDSPAPQDPLPKPYSIKCSSSTRSTIYTSTTHTTIKLVPFNPKYEGKPDEDEKLTYLGQTTGWTHTDSKTTLRYRDSV